MYARNISQLVWGVVSFGGDALFKARAPIVAITGEWSEDSSVLGSTCTVCAGIPRVTRKSNKSGSFEGSVGQ